MSRKIKKMIDYVKNYKLEEDIKKVEELYHNTPNGEVIDSDTILKDVMDESDFEFSGISLDIFEIYKGSRDKKALRQMFFEFTGIEFGEYLNRCLMETTR